MTLHKTTIEIPAQTREAVESVECDLCKKNFPAARTNFPGVNWAESDYDKLTTCVHMQEGEVYPDNGRYDETAFHICMTCFKEKLIPWLQEQGADPTITETDF